MHLVEAVEEQPAKESRQHHDQRGQTEEEAAVGNPLCRAKLLQVKNMVV